MRHRFLRRERGPGTFGGFDGGEEGEDVALDGLAELFEGEVVGVVAEGVFDFDADFFDAEEGVGDDEGDGDGPPAVEGVEGEGEGEAVEDEGASEVDDVDEGEGGFVDAFARAEGVDELGDVAVDEEEVEV